MMNEKDQLFATILHLFYTSGLQGLGKIPHPETALFQIDPIQTTESIRMLEVLKEKTQGNLSNELQITLNQFLDNLNLAFESLDTDHGN